MATSSARGSSLSCSIIASHVYCLPREGGQSPSGGMDILLYLSLRHCAYLITHSGGSGGSGTSSRTVSGIPGIMALSFQPVSMQHLQLLKLFLHKNQADHYWYYISTITPDLSAQFLNKSVHYSIKLHKHQVQNLTFVSADFSAMFLFPRVTKALANFLYDALVSILSQTPNIFTLHMWLFRG